MRSDAGKQHNRPFSAKRERFVLELYAGKSPMEAMVLAGYTARPENARRLANSEDVRARIKELFARERHFVEIEAVRARREREIIAYSNIANYFEPVLDEAGKSTGRIKVRDFTTLPREVSAAIQSIKPTKLGWEIKLHDKDAALRAIEKRVESCVETPPEIVDVPLMTTKLGKKEQALLAAQHPDTESTMGELMARRQAERPN